MVYLRLLDGSSLWRLFLPVFVRLDGHVVGTIRTFRPSRSVAAAAFGALTATAWIARTLSEEGPDRPATPATQVDRWGG
jgi:hypothetical protein